MKTLSILACTSTLLLGISQPTAAQENQDAQLQRVANGPVLLSTDAFVGCKVTGSGERMDAIGDALVEISTGRIKAFIMESGAVKTVDTLRWSAEGSCFITSTPKERSPKPVDASSPRSNADEGLGRCYLLSKVIDFPLVGMERTEEGRTETELGSIGGAFLDVQSGHLAYVTTSVGGVLGIGAKSRVIPWSAVQVRRDADGTPRLHSSITKERLDKAPAMGEGLDSLSNPEYRDTLYSYYGVSRADFEPASKGNASIVPMEHILGASIARAMGDDETLTDLVVNPETGQVAYALCDDGKVTPIEALVWNASEKRFRVKGDVTEASAKSDEGEQLLVSALTGFTVMCAGEECGDLEDIYFDTKSNRIAYLSVDHDGVRVFPWSMVAIHSGSEGQQLRLNCSEATLKSAPELDGKVGATIYSPAFRSRVDALASKKQD